MSNPRLRQVEKNLELLRAQQVALEENALLSAGMDKIRLIQRLRGDIQPRIRDHEQEYSGSWSSAVHFQP